MNINVQTRWQAFGIHILVSLFLFIILASIIYFLWYPGFLFWHDGGIDGIKLIAGVDLCIGPLLTLMVYKVGKKGLKMDLACIFTLQIACLTGGMWAVWSTRPAAVVYAGGVYQSINAHGYTSNQVEIDDIALLQNNRWPVSIAVDLTEDQAKVLTGIWAMLGSDIHYNFDNYIPYAQKIPELKSTGMTFDDVLEETSKRDDIVVSNKYANHEDVRYFVVGTSTDDGFLAVNITNGEIVDYFFYEGF